MVGRSKMAEKRRTSFMDVLSRIFGITKENRRRNRQKKGDDAYLKTLRKYIVFVTFQNTLTL